MDEKLAKFLEETGEPEKAELMRLFDHIIGKKIIVKFRSIFGTSDKNIVIKGVISKGLIPYLEFIPVGGKIIYQAPFNSIDIEETIQHLKKMN